MSRPNDVPRDVWDVAAKAWNDVYLNLISEDAATEVIARVLIAERDRCKRIAHKMGKEAGSAPCLEVALAILEGRAA